MRCLKIALLVFQRLPVYQQKPNVLFVRLALFLNGAQRFGYTVYPAGYAV